MNKELFELSKFNVLSDENNYYLFRALNNGDHLDIINGITTKDGIINRVRTDLSRYTRKPNYSPDSTISLEEVHDHVKWGHDYDTNCISLTSNSNVALTYGRGNYHDEYVIVKISKEDVNNSVIIAGLYLMEEANKRINEIVSKLNPTSLEKYFIDAIDNVDDKSKLLEIIDLIKKNYQNEISLSDSYDYLTLNESQNLEKDKLFLKLDILNENISNKFSNRLFKESLKFAFASSELIHYKEIPESKIINISKEVVDIFSLLQQMPSDDMEINEIKSELLKNIDNISTYKFPFEDYKLNDKDYSIGKMYELTTGAVDYVTAMDLYTKAYYFAKSKLRTYNTINMLDFILGENNKYTKKINFMKNHTYGIEPEISSRLNLNNMSISESVTLNFNESEKKLFDMLDIMSEEELTNIVENKDNYLIDKLGSFITDEYENIKGIKPEPISENEYYVEAIVNAIDTNNIYTKTIKDKSLTESEKYDICNALYKGNCKNLYNAFLDCNVEREKIPYYIINLYLSNGFKGYNFADFSVLPNLREIILNNLENLNYKIAGIDFDSLRNIKDDNNLIDGTNLVLRDYQVAIVDNIHKIYETKKYAGVVLATGAGKSFIAMTMMLEYKNSNIVYLSPNREINRQVQRHIIKNIISKYKSEEEVSKMVQDVNNYDNYIKQYFPYLKFRCYQGVLNNDEDDFEKLDADLIILDEMHRAGAETWSKKVNELIQKNPNAKVLGLSATPVRTDGEDMSVKLAQIVGGYSPKELLLEKHLASNMDIIQAIKDDLVVSPKIVGFDYNLDQTPEYNEIKEKYEKESNPERKAEYKLIYDRLVSLVAKAKKDGLQEIFEKYINNPTGRYIVFLPRMSSEYENDYEKYFNEKMHDLKGYLSNIDSDPEQSYVYSKLVGKNSKIIADFEKSNSNHIKLLHAIDLLDEGIHVDGINGSFMFRPIRSSYILYSQLFGRNVSSKDPNRTYKDKDRPVVFDIYNNYFCLNMNRIVNKTDSYGDLERLVSVAFWIDKHGYYPDINSTNTSEARKAKTLKMIKTKYTKYLDDSLLESLDDKKRTMIESIIDISKSLNLFDIDIPDRIIPPNEKDIDYVDTFELTASQKELSELVKESRKVGGIRNQSAKVRAITCMSVLDILDEYAIPINHITISLDMTLGELKKQLPSYAIDLVDELDLGDDYKIGYEYNELKKKLYHSRKNPIDGLDIETGIRYGLFDSFFENEKMVSFVEDQFIIKGPTIFRNYNIKTGELYDTDGFDLYGYDRHNFDRNGINKETKTEYDKNDFNINCINRKTGTKLNEHNFDIDGIWYEIIDGVPVSSNSKYNDKGFTIKGLAYDPVTHEPIIKNGKHSRYDNEGYNIDGYNIKGFDKNHINKYTKTIYDQNYFDYQGKPKPFLKKKDGTYIDAPFNKYFFSSDGFLWEKTEKGYKKTNKYRDKNDFNMYGLSSNDTPYNHKYFDRDGYYWTLGQNGNRVKTNRKYNNAFFDIDDNYWTLDENGNRVKTDKKYNEDFFDLKGNYWALDKNGNRVKTYSTVDDYGFNYRHLYGENRESRYNSRGFDYKHIHKVTGKPYDESFYDIDGYYWALDENGNRVKTDKKEDKYGFNYKHLNIHNISFKDNPQRYNRNGFDYKYIHKDTKKLYDNEFYDIDGYYWALDENGNRVKTDKKYNENGWKRGHIHKDTGTGYDPDGYNINGLNSKKFDRNHNYLGKDGVKYNPAGFDTFDKGETGKEYNKKYFIYTNSSIHDTKIFIRYMGDSSIDGENYYNLITGQKTDIRGFDNNKKTGATPIIYIGGILQLYDWKRKKYSYHFHEDPLGYDADGIHFKTGTLYNLNGYNAYSVDVEGKMKDGKIHPDIIFTERYLELIHDGKNPLEDAEINKYLDEVLDRIDHIIIKERLVKYILVAAGEMYPPLKERISDDIIVGDIEYVKKKEELEMQKNIVEEQKEQVEENKSLS